MIYRKSILFLIIILLLYSIRGCRVCAWSRQVMWGFRSRTDSMAVPLNSAVETEKAQALLQTFSTASLFASAGLGAFCLLADTVLTSSFVQQHVWLRAALDNSVHGAIALWSWAIVIGLRKKIDFYEVLLAGFLASAIDLDHFYMAGSLSLKVSACVLSTNHILFIKSCMSISWN